MTGFQKEYSSNDGGLMYEIGMLIPLVGCGANKFELILLIPYNGIKACLWKNRLSCSNEI